MSDLVMMWLAFTDQWKVIGRDYYQRMFGARLRGGKYLRELAGSVIQ